MSLLEVFCKVRKTTVFLDVNHIVIIEEAELIPSKKKACWIYLDNDYDGQGAYQVYEDPKAIIKKIEKLK